jgi:hypothetical protein
MPRMRRSTRHVGALLVLVVLLVCTAAALAAKPKKGYIYDTNNQTSKVDVYFKVSKNGKRVTDLQPGTAIKCPKNIGGVGGLPGARNPGSAEISKQGTFKAKFTLIDPGSHKKGGTETVTGKFSDDHATGKVTDHFTNSSGVCKATTRSYTAIGFAPTGTG